MHAAQISAPDHCISPNVTVLRPDYYTQPSHYLKCLVQLHTDGQNIRRWLACFWLSDAVSNHFRSMSSILHRSFSIHFRPCRNPAHSLFSSPRLPIPEPCAILEPISIPFADMIQRTVAMWGSFVWIPNWRSNAYNTRYRNWNRKTQNCGHGWRRLIQAALRRGKTTAQHPPKRRGLQTL